MIDANCSQKDSSEMVADEILSAVVDEIRMWVVQVQMVARLLKDGVALWDPDVAPILPEFNQHQSSGIGQQHYYQNNLAKKKKSKIRNTH